MKKNEHYFPTMEFVKVKDNGGGNDGSANGWVRRGFGEGEGDGVGEGVGGVVGTVEVENESVVVGEVED